MGTTPGGRNWNKQPLETEESGIKETLISDPHRTGLDMYGSN